MTASATSNRGGNESWIKSSYSNADGGGCVEWQPSVARVTGHVPLRDSKRVGGPVVTVLAGAWAALVAEVRSGAW